jgi:hypothetical protein
MARCKPVSVTTSTSTVGLPRESYTERAWILEMGILNEVKISPIVPPIYSSKEEII